MRSIVGQAAPKIVVANSEQREELLRALHLAADAIKDSDGGDQHSETGWASEELCWAWSTIMDIIVREENKQ